MKRILILVLMGIATFAGAQAPFERYFTVSWDIQAPLSNTNFIKDVSVKGFQVGYHEKINDHFYMGVDFNTMIYSQYTPPTTYYSASGDITTDFYKYAVTYGAALSGEYYFSPEKRIVPFAGLGVGANYNNYSLYYNIYASKDNGWGALIRPQAGAIFKLGQKQSWGIIAAVHYDYSTAKSSYFNYQNFASIGLRIGFVFTQLFD